MVITILLKQTIDRSIIKDLSCVFPGSMIEIKAKSVIINTKVNPIFGKAFSIKKKSDILYLKSNLPVSYMDYLLRKLDQIFKDRPNPIRRLLVTNNETNWWIKLKAKFNKFKDYTYNLEKSIWVF